MINQTLALQAFGKDSGLGVSTKYKAINTLSIVDQFKAAGFELVKVKAGRTRSVERQGFQKHVLIFRHPDIQFKGINDVIPQIVLKNSYDGSCAFKLFFGVFRLVCENGLILGEAWQSARVVHLGENAVQDAIKASFEVAKQVDRVSQLIERMKKTQLTADVATQFAIDASKIILPENAIVNSTALLRARRVADASDDLWSIFNRVQEHALRGGLRYQTATVDGRLRNQGTRAVRSVERDLTLNQRLWSLAESYIAKAV